MANPTTTKTLKIQIDTSGAPGLKDAVDRLGNLQKTANSLSSSMKYLTGVFTSFIGYLSLQQLVGMADAFTNIERRLTLTARAGEDTNVTFQKIADVADRTRTSISSVGDTYNRLAQALAGAKPSANQILAVQEGLIDTFKLSGVGAEQAASSIDALARAFARGQVQGRDLKSILGDNTVLLEALRQKFGSDLTLKAQSGVIKLSDLLKVLASIQDDVKKKAEALGPTYGETLTKGINKVTAAVGELNKNLGLNYGFSVIVEEATNHLADIMIAFGVVVAFTVIPGIIKAFNSLQAAWIAIATKNPILLIATGLVIAGALIYTHWDSLVILFKKFEVAIDEVAISVSEKLFPILAKMASFLGKDFADGFTGDIAKNIVKMKDGLITLRKEIVDLEADQKKKGLAAPTSADTLALANKNGLNQARDKTPKLKDELAKLNKEYSSGKISIREYNNALEQFDIHKLNRQFEEGAIDILKYNEGMRKVKVADLNKQLNEGRISFSQWNDEVSSTNIDALNEKFAMGTVSLYEYNAQLIKMSDEFLPGSALTTGIYDYMTSIGTLSENIAKGITTAFTQLETSFEEFIKTGTFNFAKFTQDILSDIEKIIVRALIMKPLTQGILGAIGGGGYATNGDGSEPGATDSNGGSYGATTAAAFGAAFSGGVRMFASGGIVNRATAFKFGGNQTGVMGEAGSEAILPLQRGAGGKLGVGAIPSNVFVNITNTSGAQISQSEGTGPNGERTVEIMVESAVKRGIANGRYDTAMKTSYGLQRKGS